MSRPFSDILGELGAGETCDVLTDDLAEVVTAVKETGKVGKVTLELTVKPNGAHGVAINDKITTKKPREDRGETLFFTDTEGGLHRRDPRQQKLPLRRIDGGKADPPHDPDTGEVKE